MPPNRKCEEKDSKRWKGITATTAIAKFSIKKEEEVAASDRNNNPSIQADMPDPVTSTATEPNTIITTNNNPDDDDNVDDNELPSPGKLSEKLCAIVSDRYSRAEAMRALGNLMKWTEKYDPVFLKYFDIHGGVAKVLDFLKATMKDESNVGPIRMECIRKGALVIMYVCYKGQDDCNTEITSKIVSSLMDYDGMGILTNASKEYSGGDDLSQLFALVAVWGALSVTITNHSDAMKNTVSNNQSIIVFDTGMEILVHLKLYDGQLVSCILVSVFSTLVHIVFVCNYLERKRFQDKNILSTCLDVFRKDGIWCDRGEEVTSAAFQFFNCCRDRNLLGRGADYELLLPFLDVCLEIFVSHQHYDNLSDALGLIYGACGNSSNKKTIERLGIVEYLRVMLASNDVNEEWKDTIRYVIAKITAL